MAGLAGRQQEAGMIGAGNPFLAQHVAALSSVNPAASASDAPNPMNIDVSQGTSDPGTSGTAAPMSMAPVAGLHAAAPMGASGGGATMSAPEAPTGATVMMSGPTKLRDGIGQRNPPDLTPVLTGLRRYY